MTSRRFWPPPPMYTDDRPTEGPSIHPLPPFWPIPNHHPEEKGGKGIEEGLWYNMYRADREGEGFADGLP